MFPPIHHNVPVACKNKTQSMFYYLKMNLNVTMNLKKTRQTKTKHSSNTFYRDVDLIELNQFPYITVHVVPNHICIIPN